MVARAYTCYILLQFNSRKGLTYVAKKAYIYIDDERENKQKRKIYEF